MPVTTRTITLRSVEPKSSSPAQTARGSGGRGCGRGRGRGNFNSSNASESSEIAGNDEGDLSHLPDHIMKLIEDYRTMSERHDNQDTSEQDTGDSFSGRTTFYEYNMSRHTQAFDVYVPMASVPEELYMSEEEEIFFSDKETEAEDHVNLVHSQPSDSGEPRSNLLYSQGSATLDKFAGSMDKFPF